MIGLWRTRLWRATRKREATANGEQCAHGCDRSVPGAPLMWVTSSAAIFSRISSPRTYRRHTCVPPAGTLRRTSSRGKRSTLRTRDRCARYSSVADRVSRLRGGLLSQASLRGQHFALRSRHGTSEAATISAKQLSRLDIPPSRRVE